MKVGLCACYDTYNYGSQLQSYASLVLLQSMGMDVELIKYKKKMTPIFIMKSLTRLLNFSFVKRRIKIYKNKRAKRLNAKYANVINNRDEKFSEFVKKNFQQHVVVSTGYKQLQYDANKYEVVVVGSDQLWLPSGMASDFYNLLFVPDNIKKVSFATSFGVTSIPAYQIKKTTAYLERFDYISVREATGKKIVDDLVDKETLVVVDPTLMLDCSQWNEKIGECLIKEKYIFCYFLGKNDRHRKIVSGYAKANNLKVYNLAYIDEYVACDEMFENVRDVGPFEFVNLVKNAAYVFTDSFHGSVFSILYKKQFIVFNRFTDNDKNSRNSRIDNLTKILGLEERRYNGNIELIDQLIDYEEVYKKLNVEKEKTRLFLEKALSC